MNFDKDKFLIRKDASIRDALKKIDENQLGIILIADKKDNLMAVATDGDIRKSLLEGASLEDQINDCANYDFVCADEGIPREQLIKKLDNRIKVIPIVDKDGKLQSIISRDHFPLEEEKSIYIRSRAPVRISFGGGGSDLTHFFERSAGAVINTAISIYSHGVMKLRSDSKIVISSLDLNSTLSADNLDEALSKEGPFGLLQALLKVVNPKFGFELFINSDFPVGSGLGGSATISAVVLGCFNALRKDQWTQHEMAEIAFQAERLHLGIAGGWQDQYASVFGGFNFIEFNADENIINPIRIQEDISRELEESLILCDTGIDHHSGNIHEDQKESMTSESVNEMVKANVELSFETRNCLLRGDLGRFGECLDKTWRLKRQFSTLISNEYIDSIYEGAIQNGAVGGKLLGAGGGGFFIFFVTPFEKHRLVNYLKSKNLKIQPFRFEPNGLKTWTSREHSTAYKTS